MKKIAICLSVLALASTACTDFLTEEPKLSQSKELTLSKFSGLDDAAAGTYLYLQSNAWFGCQYVLNNELMAGNATNPVSLPGSGRYREAEPWSFTESSTWSTWTYAYLTIAAANNVINNLEGKTSNEVSQKDIDNVRWQISFMVFAYDHRHLHASSYFAYLGKACNQRRTGILFITVFCIAD